MRPEERLVLGGGPVLTEEPAVRPRGGLLSALTNYHLWILLAIFLLLSVVHYAVPSGGPIPYDELGLTRHTVERVLFLIPIVYAAIIFGVRASLYCLFATVGVTAPRVFMFAEERVDSALEIAGVTLVGLLVNGWFDSLQKERRSRLKTIAELEKAEREIRLDERRLAALNRISYCLSRIIDTQEALDLALKQIVDLMSLDMALVFVLDETAGELALKASYGVSRELAAGASRLKIGEGLNGLVARTGEPLVLEDAAHDPRLTREVVSRERLVAQLIVPVRARDSVKGTLAVGMRSQRRFDSDEIEMLMAIGDELGVAFENSRLYREQKLMAEQLRQSEQNFQELFEKAHDAIWVHDLTGDMVTANEAAARLVGYSINDLLRTNVRQFLDDAGLRTAREVKHKLLAGKAMPDPYEQTLLRRDGASANLMVTTALLTRDGKPQAFQHIARDVTEQKRLTENLRFYVQQITRAQEEERKRIARELHDDTAQQLIVLSRQIDGLMGNGATGAAGAAALEKLSQRVDAILDGVRRFSQDLRPSVLDDLGLNAALEWLASDLTQHFGILVRVETAGTARRFAPEKELLVFRIVQEALSNVRRHSGAHEVRVNIHFRDRDITLTVQDNGRGFIPPERLSDLTGMAKLGLAGMAERARLLGGNLRIISKPGKGAAVVLQASL